MRCSFKRLICHWQRQLFSQSSARSSGKYFLKMLWTLIGILFIPIGMKKQKVSHQKWIFTFIKDNCIKIRWKIFIVRKSESFLFRLFLRCEYRFHSLQFFSLSLHIKIESITIISIFPHSFQSRQTQKRKLQHWNNIYSASVCCRPSSHLKGNLNLTNHIYITLFCIWCVFFFTLLIVLTTDEPELVNKILINLKSGEQLEVPLSNSCPFMLAAYERMRIQFFSISDRFHSSKKYSEL